MNNTRVGLAIAAGLGVGLLVFVPIAILFEHRFTGWKQALLFVPPTVIGGTTVFALYRGLSGDVSSQATRIAKSVAGLGTALLVIFLLLGLSARVETLPTIGATQALVISLAAGILIAGLFYFRD